MSATSAIEPSIYSTFLRPASLQCSTNAFEFTPSITSSEAAKTSVTISLFTGFKASINSFQNFWSLVYLWGWNTAITFLSLNALKDDNKDLTSKTWNIV